MSGYKLQRCEVSGELQPIWLLRFPGDGDRPLAIAQGNLVELLADYVRQGGTMPVDGDEVDEPAVERQRRLVPDA